MLYSGNIPNARDKSRKSLRDRDRSRIPLVRKTENSSQPVSTDPLIQAPLKMIRGYPPGHIARDVTMSSVALKWAKLQQIEDRTLSAVLVALARYADQNGVCEVSQAKVGSDIGMSRRTVIRSMAALCALGVIAKEKQLAYAKRGRPADRVILDMTRCFSYKKEHGMANKPWDQSDILSPKTAWDQSDKMSPAPTGESSSAHIEERARGVLSPASPSSSTKSDGVSSRVRFDRQRNSWRASLTVDGITMELGRFDTEDDARKFAADAVADVYRTRHGKAGTPRNPAVRPEIAAIDKPNLGEWLFGEPSQEQEDPEAMPSSPSEPRAQAYQDGNGAGEASALGQGPKVLAGLGGAHETMEYDAARV